MSKNILRVLILVYRRQWATNIYFNRRCYLKIVMFDY